MDEDLDREITIRVSLDPAVTPDEAEELREKLHQFIDDWCCIPLPEGMEANGEDPGDFHRVTIASSQIAYIDNG